MTEEQLKQQWVKLNTQLKSMAGWMKVVEILDQIKKIEQKLNETKLLEHK